jgi:nucleotide-binding universal stress UspA family protein
MSESVSTKRATNEFRVVVGMDMDTAGESALREALRLVRLGAEEHLHLVHVLPPTAGSARSEKAIAELDARLEAAPGKFRDYLVSLSDRMPQTPARSVQMHVRVGEIAEEIHQVAVDVGADLIVVGTNNRRGIARLLLGNTAQDLLAKAHCPVMVVRPKDFSADEPTEQPEPPCPDCVKTRAATNGEQLWCEFHARPRVRAHGVSTTEVFSFGAHGAGIQTGGL